MILIEILYLFAAAATIQPCSQMPGESFVPPGTFSTYPRAHRPGKNRIFYFRQSITFWIAASASSGRRS